MRLTQFFDQLLKSVPQQVLELSVQMLARLLELLSMVPESDYYLTI